MQIKIYDKKIAVALMEDMDSPVYEIVMKCYKKQKVSEEVKEIIEALLDVFRNAFQPVTTGTHVTFAPVCIHYRDGENEIRFILIFGNEESEKEETESIISDYLNSGDEWARVISYEYPEEPEDESGEYENMDEEEILFYNPDEKIFYRIERLGDILKFENLEGPLYKKDDAYYLYTYASCILDEFFSRTDITSSEHMELIMRDVSNFGKRGQKNE